MTLKFDAWPCKTIGHLFYTTSSFVHHFLAIGEFKLELHSGNAQSGSNPTIFRVLWPWPWPFAWTSLLSLVITPEYFMMIRWWEHSQQGKSEGFESYARPMVRKRPIWVKIGDVVPCDLEIWWMTLENNRASLLCCFKFCAIFHSHRWIQTGYTVRKRPIWVKLDVFRAVWPWNLMDDLEKQ